MGRIRWGRLEPRMACLLGQGLVVELMIESECFDLGCGPTRRGARM